MNYVSEFKMAIDEIKTKTDAGMGREDRSALLLTAVNTYAIKHAEFNHKAKTKEAERAGKEGRKPRELPFNPLDSRLLDAATDLLLNEELSDTSSNKATKFEYPFLSEFQLARRKDGAHEARGVVQKGESPISAASSYSQDLRDYRTPNRRRRSTFENIYIDEATKSRNRERRKRYSEFIKPGPVVVYKRGEIA